MPLAADTTRNKCSNRITNYANAILNCNQATVNLEKATNYFNAMASDPKNTKLCDEFIAAKKKVDTCKNNLLLAYQRVDTF